VIVANQNIYRLPENILSKPRSALDIVLTHRQLNEMLSLKQWISLLEHFYWYHHKTAASKDQETNNIQTSSQYIFFSSDWSA